VKLKLSSRNTVDMSYRAADSEIDVWSPFSKSAVPPSDVVSHPSDAVPFQSDTVDRRSVVVLHAVCRPSDTVTEAVPMWGAGKYVVAGSGLDGAGERLPVGTSFCSSSFVVFDVIECTTTTMWCATSAAILGLSAPSAIKRNAVT